MYHMCNSTPNGLTMPSLLHWCYGFHTHIQILCNYYFISESICVSFTYIFLCSLLLSFIFLERRVFFVFCCHHNRVNVYSILINSLLIKEGILENVNYQFLLFLTHLIFKNFYLSIFFREREAGGEREKH